MLLLVAAAGVLQACESEPPKGLGARVEPIQFEVSRDFSGDLACAIANDLQIVSDPSERRDWLTGTRRELGDALRRAGAEVSEIHVPVFADGAGPIGQDVHLVGLLRGSSDDRFILAAEYGPSTGRAPPEEMSPSAVALLIETARVMSDRERPYTLMILLLDASRETRNDGTGAHAFASSERLAQTLAERNAFPHIRVAAFFSQLGGHDPRVARDLLSHPVYRDLFFESAMDLGYAEVFPADAPYTSLPGSHRAFVDSGLRRVVAISGTSIAASDPLGEVCSAANLAKVGAVTVEALERTGRRLARIDRFHDSPLEAPTPTAGPEGDPTGPPADVTEPDRPSQDAPPGDLPRSR